VTGGRKHGIISPNSLLHIQVDVQGSEPTADAIFESKDCRFAILSGWENRTIAHVRRNVELQALRAKKKRQSTPDKCESLSAPQFLPPIIIPLN
jgi:hypothetical protein